MRVLILTGALTIWPCALAQEVRTLEELLDLVENGVAQECPISDQLRSIEGRSVEEELSTALQNDDLRYLYVDGLPGISYELASCPDIERQFRLLVPEATDRLCGGERARLMGIALRFAARYNQLMKFEREAREVDACDA